MYWLRRPWSTRLALETDALATKHNVAARRTGPVILGLAWRARDRRAWHRILGAALALVLAPERHPTAGATPPVGTTPACGHGRETGKRARGMCMGLSSWGHVLCVSGVLFVVVCPVSFFL